MRHQKELFLARKKELRIILKEFESTFTGLHGRYALLAATYMTLSYSLISYVFYHDRSVTKADRKPMQNEYDEYKVCNLTLCNHAITAHYLLFAEHQDKTFNS